MAIERANPCPGALERANNGPGALHGANPGPRAAIHTTQLNTHWSGPLPHWPQPTTIHYF